MSIWVAAVISASTIVAVTGPARASSVTIVASTFTIMTVRAARPAREDTAAGVTRVQRNAGCQK